MLYIFTSGILWGTVGIFVKILSSLGADVSQTSFLRMLFAFLIMFSFAVSKHGKKFFAQDKKTVFFCALLGIISNGLFNIFYSTSIKLNGMGIACVLMYTAPVFTAIASFLIFHEKFSKLKIFALILNISGCILTVTGGNIFNNANISIMGILAGLGSGFGYGMAAVFGKAAGEKTDALIVSTYSYFFAVIFLIIFSTPHDLNFAGNLKILSAGFFYGFIPTALAYMFYYTGLKKIRDISKVPVIASIEPVTAVLIGIFVFNESINAANFLGFAVVFLSIALMVKFQK